VRKIKIIGGENSLNGILPGNYLDGQMESMTENIGKRWIKDEENGKG